MNAYAEELQSKIGETRTSDWLTVDQEHLSEFGHSTYLDPAYVDMTISQNNALGPTLVDGFMLLSLLVHFDFADPVINIDGGYGFNYGFDRVRFTEPVFVDEAVRVKRTIVDVQERTPTRHVITYDIVMEVQREEPVTVMVARWVVMSIDGKTEADGGAA